MDDAARGDIWRLLVGGAAAPVSCFRDTMLRGGTMGGAELWILVGMVKAVVLALRMGCAPFCGLLDALVTIVWEEDALEP